MIPLFENVGLIGLGLIGGSLGRSIKKHAIAKSITGYTKSPESSKYALENSIIDNIASSAAQLAIYCDIIIICTPLATYEGIFKEIAPAVIGRNCIITDVGSIKLSAIKIAEKHLAPDNFIKFVPAHPIAGTEKTGVESGFAELFTNKKTILTPLKNTDANAIRMVSNLWHKCGSITQIIDAPTHDRIYAEVSHLPQFLAYCYAMLLFDNSEVITNNLDLKNNNNFWKFSRICASDPTIWLDIFSMNLDNLTAALDKFSKILAQNKSTESNKINDEKILLHIMPTIISKSLIKCSSNAQYAGSGFNDFTSYSNMKYEHSEESGKLISALLLKTEELIDLIKIGNNKNSLAFMKKASDWYVGFKDGVCGKE